MHVPLTWCRPITCWVFTSQPLSSLLGTVQPPLILRVSDPCYFWFTTFWWYFPWTFQWRVFFPSLAVQSFSIFGSAFPQEVCFFLGSYLSRIVLPQVFSHKIKKFSVKLSRVQTAMFYLVPDPEGALGPLCPCPHPQDSPSFPKHPERNIELLIGCNGPSRC